MSPYTPAATSPSSSQSSTTSSHISNPNPAASTLTVNGATTPGSTSATTTATTTSSAASSPHHSSISGGAVGGIAAGCIVAGVVIGVIVSLLFLRRRGQQKSPEPEYQHVQYSNHAYDRKGSPSAPATADNIQLNQFLLAPKPENEIADEFQALGHLIQQHVENNYHRRQIQPDTNALMQGLTDLGFGRKAEQLLSFAVDPKTRYAALRHIISIVVLNSAVFSADNIPSLLGASVCNFLGKVPPIERHRGNAEAVSVAFTRWRQISAFLLNPNRSERNAIVPQDSDLVQPARELVAALNKVIAPYIDEPESYQQETHLQDVIIECAKFGYVLFSQPEEYRLNFHSKHEIVTHPGLNKVSDENGTPYNPPQSVVRPVIERF